MQYSPKLKKAMEEIKDILSKHDIAGIVVLHTPGHSEFLSKLNPTYSCCKTNGDRIHIKAKLEDFAGNVDQRDKVIADTSNMLNNLCQAASHVLIPLIDISEKLDEIVDASHNGPGFSSPTSQNN